MKIEKYKKEASMLVSWVKQAYKIIKHTKMEVKDKGNDNDLVTNLDTAIEKFLIEKYNKYFPELSPVSEEFNSKAELSKDAFVIDPIDGTVNFANGLPGWAIQTAIVREGEPVVAVIYLPCTEEIFVAAKGDGAYLNGKQIHVNNAGKGNCLYTIDGGSKLNKGAMIEDIKHEFTRHHRSLGSAASSFSYIAKDSLGATAYLYFSYWDFLPGMLIVEEAGGKVHMEYGKYVIAANNDETLDVFKKIIAKHYV